NAPAMADPSPPAAPVMMTVVPVNRIPSPPVRRPALTHGLPRAPARRVRLASAPAGPAETPLIVYNLVNDPREREPHARIPERAAALRRGHGMAVRTAAVPRRPRRQPAAPAGAAAGPRRLRGRPDRRRPAAGDRGRRHPRGGPDAAGGRAAVGDRRRAAPRVLAHGLHLPARRDQEGPGRHHQGGVPQRAEDLRVGAAVRPRRRAGHAGPHDLRRGVLVPALHGTYRRA